MCCTICVHTPALLNHGVSGCQAAPEWCGNTRAHQPESHPPSIDGVFLSCSTWFHPTQSWLFISTHCQRPRSFWCSAPSNVCCQVQNNSTRSRCRHQKGTHSSSKTKSVPPLEGQPKGHTKTGCNSRFELTSHTQKRLMSLCLSPTSEDACTVLQWTGGQSRECLQRSGSMSVR